MSRAIIKRIVETLETTKANIGSTTLSGVVATEYGNGTLHRTQLALTNVLLPITDSGTSNAWGGVALYNLPMGLMSNLKAISSLSLAVTSNIGATGVVTLTSGTTAAAASTLATTASNILPAKATTLAGSVGTNNDVTTTTLSLLNGATTLGSAQKLYLNASVPDGDSAGASTLTLNGTVTYTWEFNGDL